MSHVAFMVDERGDSVPPLSISLGKVSPPIVRSRSGSSGLAQNDVLILRAFLKSRQSRRETRCSRHILDQPLLDSSLKYSTTNSSS